MVDSVSLVALVVSLVALVIALLQLLEQYLSSTAINKVNSGAIGAWPTKKRIGLGGLAVRIDVFYADPILDISAICETATNTGSSRACRASWCNMMIDLGLNLKKVGSKTSMVNADTIPSTLDTPTMSIKFTDLILCGLLLGMTVSEETSSVQHTVEMVGTFGGFFTYRDNSLGPVSRYWRSPVKSKAETPRSSWEKREFHSTARGELSIQGRTRFLSEWDCDAIRALLPNTGIEVRDWSTPLLVFAFCSNPAALSAFPHTKLLLKEHETIAMHACQALYPLLKRVRTTRADKGYAQRFFEGTNKHGMDDWHSWNGARFSSSTQYDHRQHGWRSWLTFPCHRISNSNDSLPILYELHEPYDAGTSLGVNWGRAYDENHKDSSELTANELFWLQITLLDSWIGMYMERFMARHPVGWVRSRPDLGRDYLTVAAKYSLMCGSSGGETEWASEQRGNEYEIIDAALTFRAVLMFTRLQLMRDSSQLLLRDALDPYLFVS